MGATIVNVKLQCQNQPDFVQDGMIAALRDILAEHNDYQNGINTVMSTTYLTVYFANILPLAKRLEGFSNQHVLQCRKFTYSPAYN